MQRNRSFHFINFLLLFTLISAPATILAGESNPQNIAINEVFYHGNAQEDWIELINRGTESVDISGWRWCARFNYPTIQASQILSSNTDLILEPGEIIALSTTIDLDNTASDLALYTSPPFDNVANMVDFVQWGTSVDVGRSDIARDKGIWLELQTNSYDFIATATDPQTLSWCGTETDDGLLTTSFDFANAPATMGLANNNSLCNTIFFSGFEAPSL